MKNKILNLFKINTKIIPEAVERSFLEHFPGAINVEWNTTANMYEAVFYLKETEHIARFSHDGKLFRYSYNVRLDNIPVVIRKHSEEFGEIMSAITILNDSGMRHEIIVRKKNFTRHLLIFDHDGNILTNNPI